MTKTECASLGVCTHGSSVSRSRVKRYLTINKRGSLRSSVPSVWRVGSGREVIVKLSDVPISGCCTAHLCTDFCERIFCTASHRSPHFVVLFFTQSYGALHIPHGCVGLNTVLRRVVFSVGIEKVTCASISARVELNDNEPEHTAGH